MLCCPSFDTNEWTWNASLQEILCGSTCKWLPSGTKTTRWFCSFALSRTSLSSSSPSRTNRLKVRHLGRGHGLLATCKLGRVPLVTLVLPEWLHQYSAPVGSYWTRRGVKAVPGREPSIMGLRADMLYAWDLLIQEISTRQDWPTTASCSNRIKADITVNWGWLRSKVTGHLRAAGNVTVLSRNFVFCKFFNLWDR